MHAQPHVLALGKIHRIGRLTPLPHGSPRDHSGNLQVPEQLLSSPHGNGFVFLQLAPGTEEKLRILNEAFSYRGWPIAPSPIEHAHFVGAELIPGNLLGEAFAVVPLGPRHRYQILHGRVGANLSAADLPLNRLRQLLHERQAARDPGHAPVEPSSKIVQAESKAAMKLGKQPSLFKRCLSFGAAQGPVQHKCLGFVHVPNRSSHRVVPKALQRPYPLVAVDNQESVGLFSQRNDHDRNLLAPFGERSQQPPLALRAADAKPFVAQVELVELQVHSGCPRLKDPGLNASPIPMLVSMTARTGSEQAVT